ncbi:MAG: hypothetical protein OXC68_11265, partial [Aestuariivita sp.]|nr:hypothetical protein [Aestuariivita sp.]
MSASCTTPRPAVGGAPVYSQDPNTHHGERGVHFFPPSGRAPAGRRQGPSEDAVEPWASRSHGSRRLAVVVS